MNEQDAIEEQRKALEKENNDMIQSIEALRRLEAAYMSPRNRATQGPKGSRQDTKADPGIFNEEAY